MSTLGKILTVLVVLVSIAVAALVAREFVLGTNWRHLYNKEHELFQQALTQRDSALQKAREERAARDSDKSLLQQQVNTLNDDLALKNNTITILTKEKENQEKRLQELSEQFKGLSDTFAKLVAEKDAWRGERDKALKEASDLRTMYTELDVKYRNVVDDLARAREQLRQTAEEKAAVESRLAYIKQHFPEVKLPDQVPALPTEKVQGLVTRVDNEAKVIQISLGSDDGVVKGMKFFVYNREEMRYLATLVVNMVSKDSAAGELSVIRGPVKVNDHVTNQFE